MENGTITIHIYGFHDIIDEIEKLGGVISELDVNADETQFSIGKYYFGKDNCSIERISNTHLIISTHYVNTPYYEYLTYLLSKYPSCLIKAFYESDYGICGVWIAKYIENTLYIQQFNWNQSEIVEYD